MKEPLFEDDSCGESEAFSSKLREIARPLPILVSVWRRPRILARRAVVDFESGEKPSVAEVIEGSSIWQRACSPWPEMKADMVTGEEGANAPRNTRAAYVTTMQKKYQGESLER